MDTANAVDSVSGLLPETWTSGDVLSHVGSYVNWGAMCGRVTAVQFDMNWQTEPWTTTGTGWTEISNDGVAEPFGFQRCRPTARVKYSLDMDRLPNITTEMAAVASQRLLQSMELNWDAGLTGATLTASATYFSGGNGTWRFAPYSSSPPLPRPTPGQKLRDMLKSRMAPRILSRPNVNGGRSRGLRPSHDFRELRARETLARVVGRERFRRYARDGFVSVTAPSGRTYQLFPGGGFSRVYQGGKLSECLCVVLTGDFPPTDSLIVRFLMVLNNEERFRELAVRQPLPLRLSHAPADAGDSGTPPVSLAELYRSFQAAATPQLASAG